MYGRVYNMNDNEDGTSSVMVCIDQKTHAYYTLDGSLSKFIKLHWVTYCDKRCMSLLETPVEVETAVRKYNSERSKHNG